MEHRGILNSDQPPASDRDALARAPWGVMDMVVAVILTFVIGAVALLLRLVALAVLGVPAADAEHDPTGVTTALVAQALLDLGAVAAAALMSIGKYHLSFRAWGLRERKPIAWGASGAVLVASFLALILYSAVVQALGLSNLKPRQDVPQSLFDFGSVVPLTVLFVVAIAPFAEECFFRGFIFNGLRRHLGMIGAALVSGFLFAAIHLSNGTPSELVGLLIPFTIIGFMFAILVARTGSLWNSILVHAAFNLVGVIGYLGSKAG